MSSIYYIGVVVSYIASFLERVAPPPRPCAPHSPPTPAPQSRPSCKQLYLKRSPPSDSDRGCAHKSYANLLKHADKQTSGRKLADSYQPTSRAIDTVRPQGTGAGRSAHVH
ncbi:unnamed protein product, partial [Iphiclides podalirius]